MARRVFPLFVIGLGLLTGCVPNDKYQALKLENEQNKQTASIAAADAAAKAAALSAMKAQYDDMMSLNEQLRLKNDDLLKQVGILTEDSAKLAERYRVAMEREPATINVNQTALNDEQDRLLQQFAAKYPDLLEYDAARGLVKFKSDVTFASGSDVLNDKAKVAIREFSSLLKLPAFNTCDFFVAGHTDNKPVTRAETLAQHKDNWYLSAHRAISVAHDLIGNGVAQTRLGVEGFAENRPVADNGTDAGRSKNRRVEVAILPRKGTSGISTASNDSVPAKTTVHAGNKDSVVAPAPKPILPPGLKKD